MTVKEYLYIALTNSNNRPFLFPPGSNFSTSVLLDASPVASQGPNTSQFMKSFMKSYNAGNVQFYDNLHKKYFDKARGQEDSMQPPQLTDRSRS